MLLLYLCTVWLGIYRVRVRECSALTRTYADTWRLLTRLPTTRSPKKPTPLLQQLSSAPLFGGPA